MKQLGAYFFLIFIFLGSINFIINQHLCNGELESTALFLEAQPCEHASAKDDLPPCHKKATNKKCCSTNQIKIQAVDWFQFVDVSHELKSEIADCSFYYSIEFNRIPVILVKEDFSLKKPPPPAIIKEDIFIWDESFLI